MMFRRNLPLAWVAGLVVLALGGVARAGEELPTLDQALRENAPAIVKELRERKYQNVGVLKFLVRNGDGPARDNAGPLNTSLADRLEVALVLALDNDSPSIIGNASKGVVASDNPRATHLTEAGRRELFKISKQYFHIPWKAGEEGVQPDAFLTGEARFSPDRRSLRISVQLFDRDNSKKVCTICEFAAASDLRSLTETGVTFARGRFDNPAQLVAKASDNAPQPDDGKDELQKKANAAFTALNKSPIRLEIRYDDKLQDVRPAPPAADKSSNVLLRVPTPEVTQKVSFTLVNTDRETYGVVLKINGQNTIKREQQDALDCKRWILKGGDSVTVSGFQLDNQDMDPFKVQPPFESELNSVYYGDNAGTISMVVFRSGKAGEAAPEKSEEAVAVATVSRGMLCLHGEPMASDLKRFQKQLRKETGSETAEARSRGLVTGAGMKGNNPVKEVDFHPIPTPELSATIRYFEPRQR